MYIDERNICIYNIGFPKLKVGSNYQIYLDEYLNWSLGHILQEAIFENLENNATCFYTKLDLIQTVRNIKQNKYFKCAVGQRILINKHYINNYN